MKFSEQEKDQIKQLLKVLKIEGYGEYSDDDIIFECDDKQMKLFELKELQNNLPWIELTISGNYDCGITLGFKKIL